MGGRLLLDTNIVIALLAGEPVVRECLRKAREVFLPSIVLGELYYGACKSARVGENVRQIDELALSSSVLACDTETARRYGTIKNALRVKGQPIPENDIWIAAIARQHDLVLVTRDDHFDQVERLSVATW